MTNLEKMLRLSRRLLDTPSLKSFGIGRFDGYRLISSDGTWCLEKTQDNGVGIYTMSK